MVCVIGEDNIIEYIKNNTDEFLDILEKEIKSKPANQSLDPRLIRENAEVFNRHIQRTAGLYNEKTVLVDLVNRWRKEKEMLDFEKEDNYCVHVVPTGLTDAAELLRELSTSCPGNRSCQLKTAKIDGQSVIVLPDCYRR